MTQEAAANRPVDEILATTTDPFTGEITLTRLPEFALRFRQAADAVWEDGYRQPFLRELGAGTLPREKFAFYLTQDSLYLNDYARVHALAMTKTNDSETMEFLTAVQHDIFHVESTLHKSYLASFGVTDDFIAHEARQSAFARAYTTDILNLAAFGDILDVLVGVLPCAWVYADYGVRLAEEFGNDSSAGNGAVTFGDNPYAHWIDMYRDEAFWKNGAWLISLIDRELARLRGGVLTPEAYERRLAGLEDIFVHGVENEYMFWASAYDEQMSWKPGWR
ncbi:thiaminase II/PqqC family protein [Bifidobacterium choloepi]|uniref:Thiaminase II n=1 Tax=Bifidobacterium choloepi TaxID=2614131 RepID=A0A6I5MZW1_9BIFI|nr:thiaminase II [Bifidobacterium choloepi]NEG70208.1 thiaminase II [Bifidobacterium choloepi]